jgi:hypothetical protein
MDGFSEFIPSVSFEQIPIKNLVSNQEYQRNLSIRHIQRTVAHFDLNQVNPVKVSRRSGLNYVINGQHTIEIIRALSKSNETPVWCMVYDDLEYAVEADIFANQQRYVKALSSYEIFMANIEAGNDDQITIRSLVESYGLKLAPGRVICGICAVSCLEQIYKKSGYHTLDRTLRLIVSTWEGDPMSLSASIIRGVSLLIDVFDECIKDDAFCERLGTTSAIEIIRNGKSRRPGTIGYAEAMVIVYNKNHKGNLQIWKLDSRMQRNRNATETMESEPDENETT